jgi:CheY-like chemotaxis protein
LPGDSQDCTDNGYGFSTEPSVPKILIIEDSPDNMKLFRTLLTLKGYQVSGLGGGEGLLEEIEQGNPDLVLMDIQLPGKDGFAPMP